MKKNRKDAIEVIRILNKDVLPQWCHRAARTITARENVELLDGIVARDAPVMANLTANIIGQMFKFGEMGKPSLEDQESSGKREASAGYCLLICAAEVSPN